MSIAEVLLVAIAGLGCGTLNAVAGGGSLLLFPALVATGMGTLAANVTNSVSTWPGYVGGSYGFREELRSQRRRVPPLAVASIAGSATGCALLLVTPTSTFDAVVPLLVAAASLLLAFQPAVSRRAGAPTDDSRPHRWGRTGGVFAATIYGGYFGAGLGVILLAVLALTVPEPLRRLNGLKSGLSVVSASVSVVAFGLFGPVRWEAVAIAAPMTLVGGYLGARVARRVDDRLLRGGVVVFGLVVAVVLALT